MKYCLHTCLTVILLLLVLGCSDAANKSAPKDTTEPVTSVLRVGGNYDTAQPVTLSCDDGEGSGCATTYYSTDGTDPPTTVYSDSDEISIGMGTITLRFYSVDTAGNSETVQDVEYTTPTVTSVVGGGHHLNTVLPSNAYTIALKSNNTVWSWGDNAQGQLGNGLTGPENNSSTPVQVVDEQGQPSLTGVSVIAAGKYHTLALKDGTVWAWGNNRWGQLGTGTSELCSGGSCSSKPVQMKVCSDTETYPNCSLVLSDVIAIAAGGAHSLALTTSKEVWAWGGNSRGQLGHGYDSLGGNVAPSQVCTSVTDTTCDKLTNIVAIAAGAGHSLALDGDGTVWAWGAGNFGQLGNLVTLVTVGNNQNESRVARPVCAVGKLSTDECIILENGNDLTQVLTDVTAIAAGGDFSIAVWGGGGKVLAWGRNDNYQIGNINSINDQNDGINALVPVIVGIDSSDAAVHLEGITAITAGGWHSLARKDDNTVWAWGGNSQGQVGDNNGPSDSVVAVQVCASGSTFYKCTEFLTDVYALADGVAHSTYSLVRKNDDTVWAWGDNEYGQLGNGTTIDSPTPVQVIPF